MAKKKISYLNIVAIVGGALAYIMMFVPGLTGGFGTSLSGYEIMESGFKVTGKMIEFSSTYSFLLLTAIMLLIALIAAGLMIVFGVIGLVSKFNKAEKANLILAIIGTVVSALAIVFVVAMGNGFGVGLGLIFVVVAFVAYFLAMIAIRLAHPKK